MTLEGSVCALWPRTLLRVVHGATPRSRPDRGRDEGLFTSFRFLPSHRGNGGGLVSMGASNASVADGTLRDSRHGLCELENTEMLLTMAQKLRRGPGERLPCYKTLSHLLKHIDGSWWRALRKGS